MPQLYKIIILFSTALAFSSVQASDKYILFAHGMNDNRGSWSNFVKYINNKKTDHNDKYNYKLLRTNVSGCASIETRAKELVQSIDISNIPDNSIIAIGHSLGGLDLRFIVGEASFGNEPYLSFAKKIKHIYTLATPHGGHLLGGELSKELVSLTQAITHSGFCQKDQDAIRDLGVYDMMEFNQKYPASTLGSIPLTALTFNCPLSPSDINESISDIGKAFDHIGKNLTLLSDGVLSVSAQTLKGATNLKPIQGRHMYSLIDWGINCPVETQNTTYVLEAILNQENPNKEENKGIHLPEECKYPCFLGI